MLRCCCDGVQEFPYSELNVLTSFNLLQDISNLQPQAPKYFGESQFGNYRHLRKPSQGLMATLCEPKTQNSPPSAPPRERKLVSASEVRASETGTAAPHFRRAQECREKNKCCGHCSMMQEGWDACSINFFTLSPTPSVCVHRSNMPE